MTHRWCSASTVSTTIPLIRPIWARSPAATPTVSPAGASPSPAQQYQADRNFLGKHTLHGGDKELRQAVWEVLLHGEDFVTLRAARSRRRDGFSGRARRHLHLPHEDTRHAVCRVVGDVRRADALQSRAPLLFQSRRRRQRRHSRPSADAGRVKPICRSTRN